VARAEDGIGDRVEAVKVNSCVAIRKPSLALVIILCGFTGGVTGSIATSLPGGRRGRDGSASRRTGASSGAVEAIGAVRRV
jgi:hypothetical protein